MSDFNQLATGKAEGSEGESKDLSREELAAQKNADSKEEVSFEERYPYGLPSWETEESVKKKNNETSESVTQDDKKESTPEAQKEPKQSEETTRGNTDDSSNQDNNTSSEEKTQHENVKHKVKVDNQEIEVSYQELINGYSKSAAANKKFMEASKMKKEAQNFLTRLQQDPMSVLKHPKLGIDIDAIANNYLQQKLEHSLLTPEQIEHQRMREELQAYRERERQAEMQAQQAKQEELKERYRQDYTKRIIDALEYSGLPKNDYTIARMVGYIKEAREVGYNPDLRQITQLVRDDLRAESTALYSQMPAEDLLKHLGEETVSKLRKQDVSRIKDNLKHAKTPQGGQRSSTKKGPKKLTADEWRAMLDKRM